MTGANHQVSVSRRIIALLRLFADGKEALSIQEISADLDIAPSTVHRLLAGLVEENIIERASKRRYCVGREFSRIGALAARKMSVRRLARPMLQQLLTSTGETVIFGMLLTRPYELMIADKLDSVHTLRYNVVLNVRRPLLWGALGRATLAWLDPEDVQAILARSSNAPGSGDPPPPWSTLQASLVQIRRAGYAFSRGQMIPGAVGLAAPVFDADDRVIGDLGVTVPEIRFRRRDEQRLASLVIAEAHRLSAALGSRGTPTASGRATSIR